MLLPPNVASLPLSGSLRFTWRKPTSPKVHFQPRKPPCHISIPPFLRSRPPSPGTQLRYFGRLLLFQITAVPFIRTQSPISSWSLPYFRTRLPFRRTQRPFHVHRCPFRSTHCAPSYQQRLSRCLASLPASTRVKSQQGGREDHPALLKTRTMPGHQRIPRPVNFMLNQLPNAIL